MRVVIVGAGALGSHVVQFLRNVECDLVVVDPDRVEAKNLANQFHGKPGTGKLKVAALSQAMLFLYGKVVASNPHKLVEDNVAAILGKADLVVDCLDNYAGRKLVQDFVRYKAIPCLHGALAADGQYGRVVWDSAFIIDAEAKAGEPTCHGGDHLPFIALVSAYLSRAAQEFIATGKKRGYEVNPAGAFST